jgi:SNF2 family DNA or RNA helicase
VIAACKLVREICRDGEKAIIWSTFVHNLEMLAIHLSDLGTVVVHGGVPYVALGEEDFSREILISKFRNDPECRLLIANPAACAESISLHQVCHHAVYLDRSFNCAHYLQSQDRIHRLGLSKSQKTCYYLLQSTGSIDEVVHKRLREKMRAMREVIESDLPGRVPGYWSEDLGEEEVVDFQSVEEHIKGILLPGERQAG